MTKLKSSTTSIYLRLLLLIQYRVSGCLGLDQAVEQIQENQVDPEKTFEKVKLEDVSREIACLVDQNQSEGV